MSYANKEADLVALRASLTADLEELTARQSPKNLAQEAGASAKAKALSLVETVKSTGKRAASGDIKSIAVLGSAAAAIVGLTLLRLTRRP